MSADELLDVLRHEIDVLLNGGPVTLKVGARLRSHVEQVAARVRELEVAVAAERERAARIAESVVNTGTHINNETAAAFAGRQIAKAIRADAGRGEGSR